MQTGTIAPVEARTTEAIKPYAYLALAVLIAASFLNYADRQIVSILAQSIKADLQLTDAQLGFLLGTAFAVFYSIIGVVMGRITDAVPRTRLLSLGLAAWSGMTALGAAVTGFGSLSLARMGVGIGEATANPCSHSLLSDYFPARNRSAAIGSYLAGGYLGSAGAMVLGGVILQNWSTICQTVPIGNACEIAGWRAVFIAMGAPGLVVAILLACLREPDRGVVRAEPRPPLGGFIAKEIGYVLPPFTLITLYKGAGLRAIGTNLLLLLAVVVPSAALIWLTGDVAQWGSIAVGSYAVITWGQVLRMKDRPLFMLTYGCPTFILSMMSSALIACCTGAVNAWAAPYAMRVLHMPPGQTGLWLGITYAIAAGIGVIAGGLLADKWKRRDPRAPIWMALLGFLGSIPPLALMLTTKSSSAYTAGYFAFFLLAFLWPGAYAALIQDLALPRMRGAAAAAFSLVSVLIGSGAGPYWAGKVSTITGSLALGILSVWALAPFAVGVSLWAAARLRRENAQTRLLRAQAAGEV